VGAAHGRFRIFVFATPADTQDDGLTLSLTSRRTTELPRLAGDLPPALTLLPTPAVNDMGAGKTVDAWDAWTERMQAEHGNGNGHGKSLAIEAQRLIPTPRATDGTKGGPNQRGSSGDLMLPSAVQKMLPTPRAENGNPRNQNIYERPADQPQNLENALYHTEGQDWREYEAAIRRQEHAFGRPAPLPTEPGKNGQPRLSPVFVEWLMGLPEGHVTGVPGISRNDMLKALGNGVVPQQAAAATRAFVHDTAKAVAA
jgi:DNA (cytosine-5)-methyltransferase 1